MVPFSMCYQDRAHGETILTDKYSDNNTWVEGNFENDFYLDGADVCLLMSELIKCAFKIQFFASQFHLNNPVKCKGMHFHILNEL